MAIFPFNRDAMRRLMESVSQAGALDEDVTMIFMTPREQRRFKRMTAAGKKAYLSTPLSPENQVVVDDLREKLLDTMLNISPKKQRRS